MRRRCPSRRARSRPRGPARRPRERDESPITCTGTDGGASLDALAVLVLHRAHAPEGGADHDACRRGAACRRCTSTVATGPRALVELRLEHDAARARRVGSARSSSTSAWSSSISSSWSMPVPLVADTFTQIVSPPKSSGDEPVLHQALARLLRVRAGQVALVDGDHDRHARPSGRGRSPRSSAA